MKVSIIIPVYNEEKTISEVVQHVFSADVGDIEKEVIISDDGSWDNTPTIIRQLQLIYPQLRTYSSPINLGKGAAVRLGIAMSTGEVIILQDADLELNPAEYSTLLKPFLEQRASVVYGSRFLRRMSGVSRRTRLANWSLTLLTNLLFGSRLSDMETGYKAFRRDVVKGLKLRCVRFDFEPEITAKFLLAGHKILEVPVHYAPRTAKEGKKIAWRDGVEAVYTLLRCRFIDSR
jgi:glycosyltransferase involved in cell wall biosynthesis